MERISALRMPETILYGRGSFRCVGEEASRRGKKALIVSDGVIAELGFVEQCKELLNKHKVEHSVFLDIKSEPVDTYVEEAWNQCKDECCDLVISIGGGSCIDTAKAVSVLMTNDGYIGEYMGGRKTVKEKGIPHIAIPTTAGTGSEVTDVTVITNTKNDIKMMIKQPFFLPDVAIVDPYLTISSPQKVTAATGVDALSHAIEAYISKKAHPMTDMFALSAMELIVKNIRRAFHDGNDIDAREAMALGALQAGTAFSNASVCLVHGMSRPIGALFHVPHGVSNAMLLPAVLEYSKEECIERLAALGVIFSNKATELSLAERAEFAVSEVKKLCLDLEIPNLQAWGIDQKKFERAINKMAADAIDSGSPANNPKVPTKEEIQELYRVCYSYQFSENQSII